MFKFRVITRSLAAGAVIAAATVPAAAQARLEVYPGTPARNTTAVVPSTTIALPSWPATQYGSVPPASHRNISPAGTHVNRTQAQRVESGAQSGFDWGDAGIGAGGALVLVAAGGGGVFLSIGRRRREQTA